jgi:predicted dehydrogenase
MLIDEHPVRIGLLGARSWIAGQAVIPAIGASSGCTLAAVAAAGGPVPDHLAHLDVGTYDAVLADPSVDAVYVPLPNGLHRSWVERAAAAGKHVLCEKPLGVDADDAAAMTAACAAAGVLLAEAWMTPFGARWAEVMNRAAAGDLGDVRHVRGDFTFALETGRLDNYRWDPAQGGGALLDVGIYALGAAVALWGAEPVEVAATAVPTVTGVDATTSMWCDWGDGRTASALVSFELPERQRLELVGTTALIVVDGPAFTGGAAAISYERQPLEGDREVVTTVGDDPYLAMVEAFARAVRGIAPWPRPASEAVALARLLDRVRAASTCPEPHRGRP